MAVQFYTDLTISGNQNLINEMFSDLSKKQTIVDDLKIITIGDQDILNPRRNGNLLEFYTRRHDSEYIIHLLSLQFPELGFNWRELCDGDYYPKLFFYEARKGYVDLIRIENYGRDHETLHYIVDSEGGRIEEIEQQQQKIWEQQVSLGLPSTFENDLDDFDKTREEAFKHIDSRDELFNKLFTTSELSSDEFYHTVFAIDDDRWEIL